MKIVVDLPNENYQVTLTKIMLACRGCSITELPKGHGRLIDVDEFHRTLEDMPIRDTDKWFNWLQKVCNRLAEAPTIIEADRSEDYD